MAEIRSTEHPTLKVPYEILNKKFRIAQKTLDRELSAILPSAGSELEKSLETDDEQNLPIVGNVSKLLDGVVEKLHTLKRKAGESISEELSSAHLCKHRLEHLKQNAKSQPLRRSRDPEEDPEEAEKSIADQNQWKKVRLNRFIVEHFLRLGYYDTAELLANRSGIREISNVDIFRKIREIEKDLAEHNTGKCITWIIENKGKLRKIKSEFEFKLRQQEFIEMIRCGQRLQAVKHAQKYFPAFETDQLDAIKKCMVLLALPIDTTLEPYKSMLDIKRWDDFLINFRLENYRLLQIPTESVLSVAVQTGLSALKTPQCYSENSKNSNCPVCQPNIGELAEPLPFSHCTQSRLICRVTKKPLDENNQPMVLPNGFVVGELALSEITKENGEVVCPFTNETWKDPEIEKVYVM